MLPTCTTATCPQARTSPTTHITAPTTHFLQHRTPHFYSLHSYFLPFSSRLLAFSAPQVLQRTSNLQEEIYSIFNQVCESDPASDNRWRWIGFVSALLFLQIRCCFHLKTLNPIFASTAIFASNLSLTDFPILLQMISTVSDVQGQERFVRRWKQGRWPLHTHHSGRFPRIHGIMCCYKIKLQILFHCWFALFLCCSSFCPSESSYKQSFLLEGPKMYNFTYNVNNKKREIGI